MSQNAFQLGVSPYNAVAEKWSKVLLKNLRVTGVFRHIGVDHSSELAANADSLHLRIVDDTAINVGEYYTRSEDAGVAGQEGAIVYADAKVNKHTLQLTESPYAAVGFEDYALKFSDVNFQAEIIEGAKHKIARQLDTMIMDAIIAAAGNTLNEFDATAAGEGDMYDLLLQISAKLKEEGAITLANPSDLFGDKGMKGVPYVVVNPATMRYILKEPAFTKVDFTDKNAMWKAGTVRGTIAGLMVLESSNLPTAGGYVNVFAGVKEATHYAIKTVTTRMMPAEDKFRMLWSTLYAAGVLVTQPKALVKVRVKVAQA